MMSFTGSCKLVMHLTVLLSQQSLNGLMSCLFPQTWSYLYLTMLKTGKGNVWFKRRLQQLYLRTGILQQVALTV